MTTQTSHEPPAIVLIPLALLRDGPADQQRLHRDPARITDLAHSIERLGVITPLLVREIPGGYETVAGGYRREAARLAGLAQVPAIVVHAESDTAWAISWTENTQRTDLSPVEEAEIVRIAHVEHQQTLEQIAHEHGRSVAWVQERLDLLTWDPAILEAVHTKQISKAAAAPLAAVENPTLRYGLLEEAIRYGATARVTANWVRTAKLRADSATPNDLAAITSAPQPPTTRVLATCWMCANELEIAHASHLPTCPLCVEAVRRARDTNHNPLHADSAPTAASHSSAVTPA